MKKEVICFIFVLLSLNIVGQKDIFFNLEYTYPQSKFSMYFSPSKTIEIGYKHDFRNLMSFTASIKINKLTKNIDYFYQDAPKSDSVGLSYCLNANPELYFSSAVINTNLQYTFRKQYKLQPFVFTGINVGYYSYYYDYLESDYEKALEQGSAFTKVWKQKVHIGFQAGTGIYLKLSDQIKLQLLTNYNIVPSCKYGRNRVIYQTVGGLVGITIGLGSTQ